MAHYFENILPRRVNTLTSRNTTERSRRACILTAAIAEAGTFLSLQSRGVKERNVDYHNNLTRNPLSWAWIRKNGLSSNFISNRLFMHSCIASETLFVLQVKLFKWKDLVRLFILTNSFFFSGFWSFPWFIYVLFHRIWSQRHLKGENTVW